MIKVGNSLPSLPPHPQDHRTLNYLRQSSPTDPVPTLPLTLASPIWRVDYLPLSSLTGLVGEGTMNFSCPAFKATCISRPVSWKKLVFIWIPVLEKSGMTMPMFVTNSTDTEGFVTSSICNCKSENDLFSFIKYPCPCAVRSTTLPHPWAHMSGPLTPQETLL